MKLSLKEVPTHRALWGTIEPVIVANHSFFAEISTPLSDMLWVFLFNDVHNDVWSFIEYGRRSLPSSQALFLDVFKAADRRNTLIIKLIPSVEFLWVKVWDIVHSIKCYKTAQNIEGRIWSWLLYSSFRFRRAFWCGTWSF